MKNKISEAVFYHIYPLGMCGAPKKNDFCSAKSDRLNILCGELDYIKSLGVNAIYIGPLFESSSHGYDTVDYYHVDRALGNNEDFKHFVEICHNKGISVIVDAVFNHTGRDFFAFKDLQANGWNSQYKDWYKNVRFDSKSCYGDNFSYEGWAGHMSLVKLDTDNASVRQHIFGAVEMWIREFDIDGLRLDAADVLDFDFMKKLRKFTESLKPDFWLMGEVIHGDYQRWANAQTLHSVTNYQLHKALYSGYNDHNYFEIAHTVNRFIDMCKNGIKLYNFVDNHDVERIFTKLNNKDHMIPVHILLFTLFGIPSVYYGSEFCVEGKKEKFSDDSLRPMLNIEHMKDMKYHNKVTNTIMKLANLRQSKKVFSRGDYKELLLTNHQYAFSMSDSEDFAIVAVNNDENAAYLRKPLKDNRFEGAKFKGQLSGATYTVNGGVLECNLDKCMGEVFCLE